MAHVLDPGRAVLGREVAGAARDEPAHRVPDERDLGDLDRPGGDQGLEQVGERAPVLGDVAAAVVADVDRACSRARARAACRRARGPGAGRAASRPRCPSGRGRRRRAAGWRPGRRAASASRSSGTGRPSTRIEIGSWSGLRSRSRRSPTRPLSAARPRPPGSVAESGRCGRGRRATTASAPRPSAAVAPPRAPTTPSATLSCTKRIGLPSGDVAEGAGGDLPLHGADAPREAVELVEAEADEGAGLVVLARQLCHGSMYLRFG